MKPPLEYSYIRSESDNTYTVFLSGESDWINKNIDISLNENHELVVSVSRSDSVKNNSVTNNTPRSVLNSFPDSGITLPENKQNEYLNKNQNESLAGLTPLPSNDIYVTGKMPACLLPQFQNFPTRFILCNVDADFLSEVILPPLSLYSKSDLGGLV